MKTTYLAITLVVIGISIGFTMWAFTGSMTPYVDIRTARTFDRPVQVRGRILHETVRYDNALKALRFRIEDKNKEQIEVVYYGGKPESFDSAPQTAALGMIQDGVFRAKDLVVQCPSRYDDKSGPYRSAQATGGTM